MRETQRLATWRLLTNAARVARCADPAFAASSATVSDEDLQAFGVLLGGSGASRVRAAARLTPTKPAPLQPLARTRSCCVCTAHATRSAATVVTAVLALVVGSEQVRRASRAGL